MYRTFLSLAAAAAMLGVAAGAFGAHGLRAVLSEADLATYRTAVEYQMWHALGLGLVAFAVDRSPGQRLLVWAGWLMAAGILLFSGSLYLLAISHIRWLGFITPFGGLAFLAAWILLLSGVRRFDR
jgi:uncharacterized membrane protein YgdD (TMEM256/DUF423 family)